MIQLINLDVFLFDELLKLKFFVDDLFKLQFLVEAFFLKFVDALELFLIALHESAELRDLMRKFEDVLDVAVV